MATYTETVKRLVEVEESVEVPEGLVSLVNGKDKKFGRNGWNYLGCDRSIQGGLTIDRLTSYLRHHQTYHVGYGHPCDCPIVPERRGV